MATIKQAIVMRDDIGMSRGKMIAQACHASLGAYNKASKEQKDKWKKEGGRKIVLDAGENDLVDILEKAKRNDLPAFMVKDAGRTELEPGTQTAVGIGPAEEDKIDTVTGELRLIG